MPVAPQTGTQDQYTNAYNSQPGLGAPLSAFTNQYGGKYYGNQPNAAPGSDQATTPPAGGSTGLGSNLTGSNTGNGTDGTPTSGTSATGLLATGATTPPPASPSSGGSINPVEGIGAGIAGQQIGSEVGSIAGSSIGAALAPAGSTAGEAMLGGFGAAGSADAAGVAGEASSAGFGGTTGSLVTGIEGAGGGIAGSLIGHAISGKPPSAGNTLTTAAGTAAGAYIGTAIMPGVGTVIGAALGAIAGSFFGPGTPTPLGAVNFSVNSQGQLNPGAATTSDQFPSSIVNQLNTYTSQSVAQLMSNDNVIFSPTMAQGFNQYSVDPNTASVGQGFSVGFNGQTVVANIAGKQVYSGSDPQAAVQTVYDQLKSQGYLVANTPENQQAFSSAYNSSQSTFNSVQPYVAGGFLTHYDPTGQDAYSNMPDWGSPYGWAYANPGSVSQLPDLASLQQAQSDASYYNDPSGMTQNPDKTVYQNLMYNNGQWVQGTPLGNMTQADASYQGPAGWGGGAAKGGLITDNFGKKSMAEPINDMNYALGGPVIPAAQPVHQQTPNQSFRDGHSVKDGTLYHPMGHPIAYQDGAIMRPMADHPHAKTPHMLSGGLASSPRPFATGGMVNEPDAMTAAGDSSGSPNGTIPQPYAQGGSPTQSLMSPKGYADGGMPDEPPQQGGQQLDPGTQQAMANQQTAEQAVPKEGTADDVPAKLSKGEFVMDAATVMFYGLGKLVKMQEQAHQEIAKHMQKQDAQQQQQQAQPQGAPPQAAQPQQGQPQQKGMAAPPMPAQLPPQAGMLPNAEQSRIAQTATPPQAPKPSSPFSLMG